MVTLPVVVIRPIVFPAVLVNPNAPSLLAAIPSGPLIAGVPIWPTDSPAKLVNPSVPRGPAAIPSGLLIPVPVVGGHLARGRDLADRVVAVGEPQCPIRPGSDRHRIANAHTVVEGDAARCRYPADRVANTSRVAGVDRKPQRPVRPLGDPRGPEKTVALICPKGRTIGQCDNQALVPTVESRASAARHRPKCECSNRGGLPGLLAGDRSTAARLTAPPRTMPSREIGLPSWILGDPEGRCRCSSQAAVTGSATRCLARARRSCCCMATRCGAAGGWTGATWPPCRTGSG